MILDFASVVQSNLYISILYTSLGSLDVVKALREKAQNKAAVKVLGEGTWGAWSELSY